MKVSESEYIVSNKPLFKELVNKLNAKYQYASVLAEDSFGKRYSADKSGVNVGESEMLTKRGFVVRVYEGGCYAEYSGNLISSDEIDKIADIIDNRLVGLGSQSEKSKYEVPVDESVVLNESTEYLKDPVALGDEKIVEKMQEIHKKGMSYDEKIVDCLAISNYQRYTKLFLSRNKDMVQNVMWASGYVIGMTLKGEELMSATRCFSNLGGMEVLDTMSDSVEGVCKTAIELMNAENLTPGEYECICSPETTGMIVHEAFGHGVEMDMFVKDRALAQKYVGEYVASPLITMHDGNRALQTATYFFDDEGTLSHDTVIIDKGILVAGISDLQSALALGTVPTGNGRRESYERKAYTRMTNTYFEAGTDKLEDMIASVKDGLLLEDPNSGMEDPKNWGIQCMVNIAREIKDGKLTGRIFSPIVLTGYVPDLLKSISMVSDKAELSGTGYCGKGYKEWVKVSDGGPYIKAKIRLG